MLHVIYLSCVKSCPRPEQAFEPACRASPPPHRNTSPPAHSSRHTRGHNRRSTLICTALVSFCNFTLSLADFKGCLLSSEYDMLVTFGVCLSPSAPIESSTSFLFGDIWCLLVVYGVCRSLDYKLLMCRTCGARSTSDDSNTWARYFWSFLCGDVVCRQAEGR